MKKSSFLQRQLFLSLAATVILVVGGFATSFYVMHSRHDEAERGPAVFFARLMDSLSQSMTPEQAFAVLQRSSPGAEPHELFLLDESGKLLMSSAKNGAAPPPFDPTSLPTDPYKSVHLGGDHLSAVRTTLTRLGSTPARYLVFRPMHRGPDRGFMGNLFSVVLIYALLSALFSFLILVSYLRRNSLTIEEVIAQLHSGNLKARFPVKRLDEFGRVMIKFNEMAEEIERLVGRVQATEKARLAILQELGHDLRTPLASLRNMLETLLNKSGALSVDQTQDLVSTSVKEVVYLSHLVNDLLFLARVDDPRSHRSGTELHVRHFLESEVERFGVAHASAGKQIRGEFGALGELTLYADPHLLQRMIRNGLENALRFARTSVTLRAESHPTEGLRIFIEDDGVGMPDDVLGSFGFKRDRRSVTEHDSQKISLGLGSVIMRAVALAHRGTLTAENRLGPGGEPLGARIQIKLPIS